MPTRLSEYRLFFREYLRNFHTTGAIAPSGRSLARALSRYVAELAGPKRVLEVGPGTGAVTRRIIDVLGPEDRLDLVELNERFVERLRERFETESCFQRAASRTTILHCAVEEAPADGRYDVIVSGLPLNNFAVDQVEKILDCFARLARPGGFLSFFEYIAIRRLRGLVSGPTERKRLRGIGQALHRTLDGREIRRDWIWPNVPPAWVHHVQFASMPKEIPS